VVPLKSSLNFLDIFTHGDEIQKTSGKWYFHRTGSGYKGGSYKGLDITFSRRGFGGILIRAIKNVSSGEYIEGPCMVVNKILESNSKKEIVDFVGSEGFESLDVEKKSRLYLRPETGLEQKLLQTSGRFGLVLRNDEQAKFVLKPYRFMSFPNEVRKGRQHLVLDLHHNGKTVKEISEISGCTPAQSGKWTSVYDETKSKGTLTAKSFYAKKTTANEFSQFYHVLKVINDAHK